MKTDAIIQRIRDLIDYFGYTEYQFAKYVSIDKSNLSKLLSGQRTIGEGVINKIVLATIDIAMGHKIQGMAGIYINRNLKKVSDANRKVIDYLKVSHRIRIVRKIRWHKN